MDGGDHGGCAAQVAVGMEIEGFIAFDDDCFPGDMAYIRIVQVLAQANLPQVVQDTVQAMAGKEPHFKQAIV